MRVISRGTLRDFWEQPGHADAEEPLTAWYAHVKNAEWQNWNDVKSDFPRADWVGNERIVFNILRNKYRLIVKIQFSRQHVYVRFIGTHKDYDNIRDIRTI